MENNQPPPYLAHTWGVYVWLGAMLGASGAFLIGRYLGRDFAASLIGPLAELAILRQCRCRAD